jgi:hypothetical protein
MKTLLYLFIVFCGIISITAFSCQKDDWIELKIDSNINPNCGCNSKSINQLTDFQTVVESSKDSTIWQNDTFRAILFNPDSNLCFYVVKQYDMISISKICNYPIEIKNWNLSNNNVIKVKISGSVYESCKPQIDITNTSHSDFLLTKMYKLK